MLTLTFLGVGSAFAKRNLQSSALIEAWASGPDKQDRPDDALLIDFGATGPLALHRLKDMPEFSYLGSGGNICYSALRGVIITHLHADHIGGLEEWASIIRFARCAETRRPELFGSAELIRSLWEHSLRGGLGSLNGRQASLEDYFAPKPLDVNDKERPLTMMERFELGLFPTDHIRVERQFDWPSFGVSMRDASTGSLAIYSGDTRFDRAGFGGRMDRACIIFHDVQLEDSLEPIHASLKDLRTLPEAVRKRTYLYHYSDEWDDPSFNFVSREFAGFAQPNQRYVLFGS